MGTEEEPKGKLDPTIEAYRMPITKIIENNSIHDIQSITDLGNYIVAGGVSDVMKIGDPSVVNMSAIDLEEWLDQEIAMLGNEGCPDALKEIQGFNFNSWHPVDRENVKKLIDHRLTEREANKHLNEQLKVVHYKSQVTDEFLEHLDRLVCNEFPDFHWSGFEPTPTNGHMKYKGQLTHTKLADYTHWLTYESNRDNGARQSLNSLYYDIDQAKRRWQYFDSANQSLVGFAYTDTNHRVFEEDKQREVAARKKQRREHATKVAEYFAAEEGQMANISVNDFMVKIQTMIASWLPPNEYIVFAPKLSADKNTYEFDIKTSKKYEHVITIRYMNPHGQIMAFDDLIKSYETVLEYVDLGLHNWKLKGV